MSMRFVDEYRSGEVAKRLAAEIEELAEPGRHYKVMEVCGGHTHSIYQHGVEDLLPPEVELVHGPGCPVCVIPMGRQDDAIAIAERPEVIFTTFGDMMRVPASNGSLLDAKSRGADVRMVYSPLDALKIARDNPDRQVVFFAIGFETTTPSTAITLLRAARRDPQLLPVRQPRDDHPGDPRDSRLARPSSGRLHRPRPRGHRDRHAPVPVHRARLAAPGGGVGLRAARRAPGRAHGALPVARWTLRDREPVQPRGPRRRQSGGDEGDRRDDGAAHHLRVARAWLHLPERAEAAAGVRRLGCRGALRGARRAGGRPQGVPVRRGAQGRDQALGVQGLRHRLYAGASDRHLHGLQRGACAAYYNYGRHAGRRRREEAPVPA